MKVYEIQIHKPGNVVHDLDSALDRAEREHRERLCVRVCLYPGNSARGVVGDEPLGRGAGDARGVRDLQLRLQPISPDQRAGGTQVGRRFDLHWVCFAWSFPDGFRWLWIIRGCSGSFLEHGVELVAGFLLRSRTRLRALGFDIVRDAEGVRDSFRWLSQKQS